MQDDPPEDDVDEFDGMLDDAPSTAAHFPEDDGLSRMLDNEPTTPDKASG